MSTTVLLDVYRTRAEALDRVVELWAANHGPAGRALDLDDLARECLEYPALMKRLNDRIFDWIKAEGDFAPATLTHYGDVFRGIFDTSVRLLQNVQGRIRAAAAAGEPVAAAAALDAALREMERLEHDIFDPWPFFRPDDRAVALAEIEGGEYKEVAGELSGTHP